jgi:hypothetical protein
MRDDDARLSGLTADGRRRRFEALYGEHRHPGARIDHKPADYQAAQARLITGS